MADVFISYAREDAETAQRLAAALERRGLSVFWDRRIPAGRRFADVIGEQLADARCVIALWSKAAAASDWVLEEAEEARKRGVLAPALIEAIEPPMGFRRIHAADLIGWRSEPAHVGFDRLMEDIARYLPPRPPPAAPSPEPPAPSPPPPRSPSPPREAVEPVVVAARPAAPAIPSQPEASPTRPVVPRLRARFGRLWLLALVAGLVIVLMVVDLVRRSGRQRPTEATPASKTEPPADQGRAADPLSPGGQRLLDAVLAALPSPAERQQGSWRNSADPKLLEALDSMEKFVTRGIADMDRQGQAEGFQPAWQHVDDLVAVMTPKSLVVDPRTLSGSWNCRRLEVDKSGVLDRGVFRCGIEARSDCLELSKGTGSVRFRGCLHPAGDRHLVFVGRQASFDSEGRRMAEGSEGGFLSQTGTRRVRMILPSRMAGFDVIDLRRP